MTVSVEHKGRIAVLTIDNPPVNALGRAVREALLSQALALNADPSVAGVVLCGAGRMFVGGADIGEFDRAPEGPHLPEVIAAIEEATKPWVAALHGTALGGGLELALGCRFRVATEDTKLGLPEVGLGIIPGAGGTQRLPRLIGVEVSIPVVAERAMLDGAQALVLGLLDRIDDTGNLIGMAVELAREASGKPLPLSAAMRPVVAPPGIWEAAGARIDKAAKGNLAPRAALDAMRHGVEAGFVPGLAAEREAFLKLRASEEAAALRYLFFAERAALRPRDLRDVAPMSVCRVGVVGGGTMGAGIAAAMRNAGLAVILSERDDSALARGMATVKGIFEAAARRGLTTPEQATERLSGVHGTVGLAAMANCDLVIEAVFEDLAIKRAVFAELGGICRHDAILATNTSYIDPRLIAEAIPNPERFLGLHFFSPAQVMKLLEIIPTMQTDPRTLATSFDLARKLGKVPVRAGICDGFIGNRILRRYRGEAEALVRQGVEVQAIDAAMRDFGFAMGPFEMQDMAGLDISFLQREAARTAGEALPPQPGDLLVRAGRKGQKTGAGWYDYAPGSRTPQPSVEAARLIAPLVSGTLALSGEVIADRILVAMATEGQAILDEGIAGSPADIDLVEIHGYGFPRSKGGPMFLAARKAMHA
jgi:3-hydroxyacyl-CoA dehydrogenase